MPSTYYMGVNIGTTLAPARCSSLTDTGRLVHFHCLRQHARWLLEQLLQREEPLVPPPFMAPWAACCSWARSCSSSCPDRTQIDVRGAELRITHTMCHRNRKRLWTEKFEASYEGV